MEEGSKLHFHYIISRVLPIYMIHDCWCWPWSPVEVVFIKILHHYKVMLPPFPRFYFILLEGSHYVQPTLQEWGVMPSKITFFSFISIKFLLTDPKHNHRSILWQLGNICFQVCETICTPVSCITGFSSFLSLAVLSKSSFSSS